MPSCDSVMDLFSDFGVVGSCIEAPLVEVHDSHARALSCFRAPP